MVTTLVPTETTEALYIMDLCNTAHNNTEARRLRMLADFDLYRLEEFSWRQLIKDTIPPKAATITSNEPKTLGNGVMALLSSSLLTWRSPTINEREEIQMAGRAREQLFHGLLSSADRMRLGTVEPPLKDQLAYFMALRGFAIGLHLLTRDIDGQTMPIIEPWDPLNVYWGVGSRDGRQGLLWACHYQDMDAWRLDMRFGTHQGDISRGIKPTFENDGKPLFRIYDYYDREYNVVVADGKVIHKQRHFGLGKVPVTIIPVGPGPMIVDSYQAHGYDDEFGQSVFASNRKLYPKLNSILSTKYERILQMNNPAVKEKSKAGSFRIDPETASVFQRGLRIPTATDNDEDIEPIDLPELPADALQLEASMGIQLQKGGLPVLAQGQTGNSPSGFNTNVVLNSQITLVLQPYLPAMKQWYEAAEMFLATQYSSGYFPPLHLAGEINRRTPYNLVVEPSAIAEAPAPVVNCRVKQPSELAQRISLAQTLMQGPFPLADHEYILDEVLEVDDPDSMMKRLALQNAIRALPQTQLWEALLAAESSGREDLASLLGMAVMQFMQGNPMLMQQGPQRGQAGTRGGGGGTQGGGARGASTQAGGSPRSGQPNESGPPQQGGRPREPGTR